MAIKVHGETYKDAEDLALTIDKLEVQLGEMSSDTPAHKELSAHVERLREALMSALDDPGQHREAPEEVATEPPPDQLVCATCGKPWDRPDMPLPDPTTQTCPDCQGWGKVFTGSRVDGHAIRDCQRCMAQGYITREALTPQPVAPRAAAAPDWPGAEWNAETSSWNPPPGDPPWPGARWNQWLGKYEQ